MPSIPLSLPSSSSGASAIGQENKNKKPKEKPKQNTSPSANVSQSLNSHHTPSSATKTLPIDFFHNKTSLRPESNTVRKNVNAAPAAPLKLEADPGSHRPTRSDSTELALNTRYLPITSLQVGTYVSTNLYVTGRNWGGVWGRMWAPCITQRSLDLPTWSCRLLCKVCGITQTVSLLLLPCPRLEP
jgi:hypothetical protein